MRMRYVYAEISIRWHMWGNRMERWIRFFRSYVICQISGPDVERFLNMCRHRDITFFDMCREADGIRAGILVEDFKRIKPMAVKTRTKIHIKRRRGHGFPQESSPLSVRADRCYSHSHITSASLSSLK